VLVAAWLVAKPQQEEDAVGRDIEIPLIRMRAK
jgi:hypothetical protein